MAAMSDRREKYFILQSLSPPVHAGCEVVAYCGRAHRIHISLEHIWVKLFERQTKRGIVEREQYISFSLFMWKTVCRQLFYLHFFTRYDHMFVIFRLNIIEFSFSLYMFAVVVCIVWFCCAHIILGTDSYLFHMTALSDSMEKYNEISLNSHKPRAISIGRSPILCGRNCEKYFSLQFQNNSFTNYVLTVLLNVLKEECCEVGGRQRSCVSW